MLSLPCDDPICVSMCRWGKPTLYVWRLSCDTPHCMPIFVITDVCVSATCEKALYTHSNERYECVSSHTKQYQNMHALEQWAVTTQTFVTLSRACQAICPSNCREIHSIYIYFSLSVCVNNPSRCVFYLSLCVYVVEASAISRILCLQYEHRLLWSIFTSSARCNLAHTRGCIHYY